MTIKTGQTRGTAIVEWKASPITDILADSVIALLMHTQSSAASIRLTSKPCYHGRSPDTDETEDGPEKKRSKSILRMFHDTLLKQFEDIEATFEAKKATFEIKTDAGLESGALTIGEKLVCNVIVELPQENSMNAKISVDCSDLKLAGNVQECLKRISEACLPL